jgi:hypothetical protein
LQLDRKGDALILCAKNSHPLLGGLGVVFGMFWTFAWVMSGKPGDLDGLLSYRWLSGFLGGIFIIVCFLFAMLPLTIMTTFDMKSRTVVYSVIRGGYRRDRTYAFGEIEGIGVEEQNSEAYTYKSEELKDAGCDFMPVVKLKNGRTCSLATTKGEYARFTKIMDTIVSTTGLPGFDEPAGWRAPKWSDMP